MKLKKEHFIEDLDDEKRKEKLRKENILIIIITILSVITANEWKTVIDMIFQKYFKNDLTYRILYSILLTVFVIYLVNFILLNYNW